jgi:hypothetical protein
MTSVRLQAVPNLLNRCERRQSTLRTKFIGVAVHLPCLSMTGKWLLLVRNQGTILLNLGRSRRSGCLLRCGVLAVRAIGFNRVDWREIASTLARVATRKPVARERRITAPLVRVESGGADRLVNLGLGLEMVLMATGRTWTRLGMLKVQ